MQLGAHEVLELHEVLSDAIHGINTLKLYRPHAHDRELQAMTDRHLNSLMIEYNQMVGLANHHGAIQAIPSRRGALMMNQSDAGFQPKYGLRNPQPVSPAETVNDITDEDVATCLVNCHKQTAALKMKATMEMAHPQLRHMMQTAANASADMAYEAFQYANQRGMYQVPTLKDTTMNTFMSAYRPMNVAQTNLPVM
ncbi:spore coat protein [Paenibacillus turpanensis]|uniref:spore coat protein n=1 Tax=Paenibacillus turpanensis TaxID=2689078 RepID=UPI0014080A13|nr:spore coat protein [Paenibacillus turpanensis]